MNRKMNKKQLHQIDEEVLKTLENLETLPKLKASSFFAARLEAKIEGLSNLKKNKSNSFTI